jgi:hypothetical protein
MIIAKILWLHTHTQKLIPLKDHAISILNSFTEILVEFSLFMNYTKLPTTSKHIVIQHHNHFQTLWNSFHFNTTHNHKVYMIKRCIQKSSTKQMELSLETHQIFQIP